ncbi:hypothetical protein [Brevundimonas lutea]|uniref:hypothetical protein n=1 Tax=Brevundimonas lutea TaxID=2293980 RepID=UPI000F03B281|nr:hypothetical protein [Brevundimonas lutea]
MSQDPNPAEALASIRQARDTLLPPATYPISYDLIYGVICGLLVACQGLPQPWSLLVLVISLAGLALMVRMWRDRMGYWINGYSPRRARWVAIGMVVVFIALMGGSLYGRYVGPDWLFLVTGALGFVTAIIGGRVWMAVWRRELAETGR